MRYSGVRRRAVGIAVMLAAACSNREDFGAPGAGAVSSFGGSAGFGGGAGFSGTGGFAAFGASGGSGAIAGFGAVAGAIELPTDPAANGAPLAPNALPNEYAPENCASTYGFGTACVQYFACELRCTVGSLCPNGQSGTPRVRCVTQPFPSPTCVLGCGDGAVCPNGMQCVVTGEATLGSICLWPDHLLREGCPGWCIPLGNACTSPADDCCDGSVCAPWGQCTLGTCREPGWPCEVGGPQCCSGSCQNGACL